MKIAFTFNLVLVLLVFSFVQAQPVNQSSIPDKPKSGVVIPFEKVYLHLDRVNYSSGEDIWFKAYLVNALTNELYDNSNNLYVDLVSPESKIIKQLILRMDNGLGTGDIHLGDSIISGNYQIRAYTNWMRNFGEVFFFTKEIVIENQSEKKAINRAYQKNSNENVDVQFSPEGGSLIENVYTLMGFKAVNSSGYGCDIMGHVISSLGDTVTIFASTHLGMGSFLFLPKKGLKYFATGSAGNGMSFRTELPTALETGYSLQVSDINKTYFRATIKTNQETLDQFPNHELVIVGTSHNSLCVTARLKVKKLESMVNLPKKEFPEGIARITLMDTVGKAYCERVCYVQTMEKYRISIVPDSNIYAPKQRSKLRISVKDTSNNPVAANLSVSIVNGNKVKDFDKNPDICSYFLLESEIKGHIEQPFYYFDTTIADRFDALDNLLLTQGWRNFVWNSLPESVLKFNYPVEKGITVSGRLTTIMAEKPIANATISMALSGDDKSSYKFTLTDSIGKYYFDGLNISGPQTIMLSAATKKGLSRGSISLDSIIRDTAPVNYNPAYKPEILETEESNNEMTSIYKEDDVLKDNPLKKYHLTDTIPLHEFVIKANKPFNENADGHYRMYGEPDFSMKVTEKMYGLQNVFRALAGKVARFNITFDSYALFVLAEGTPENGPLYLIDGKEVDFNTISSLPISDVDKIEVLKTGGKLAFYGFRGSNGVISVLTKRGGIEPPKSDLSTLTQKVNGYYQARIFYSPQFEMHQSDGEKPDLRTTIHWEPNILTDKDGNATVSFLNTDTKTIIKVDVEGIGVSGIPLAGKASFDVK
ncbi:MAG: TonB-dependent receptor plug domain-containing protein [Bacteroidia bacterium]|nr:TonB-dependent receptor plug domain-containing protein [Bacteroidia bacterium]